MREQICEMCESRPANCGLIDIVNQETIFLCYHCSEKLADIHERIWGHVVIRHARWVSREKLYECSECGFAGYPEMNYCPWCGAKMYI